MTEKDLQIQDLRAENEKLRKQLEELKESALDPIEMCKVKIALDKLKEYQRLEEQGLLLKSEVAIGSDVYFIPSKANFGLNVLHHHEEFNRVYHQKIARIHFTESGWYAEGNLNLEYGLVDRVFVDKLYKVTWFLTEQEAQSALEKMKVGGVNG